MIDDVITKIRENWLLASEEFAFKILTPYQILIDDKERNVFAFLPDYGSDNGMVIELIYPPEFNTDKEIIEWSRKNGCFFSFINAESYSEYEKALFGETLKDWKLPPKPPRFSKAAKRIKTTSVRRKKSP